MEYKAGAVYDFKLFGFATGAYQCFCSICNQTFFGDKRASMCLGCAIKRAESLAKQPPSSHNSNYAKLPSLETLIEELEKTGWLHKGKFDILEEHKRNGVDVVLSVIKRIGNFS